VERLRWFVHVVPRTLRAFVPALASPDDDFARAHLRGGELELYLAMDRRDRHHGVAVARAVLARDPRADDVVVRAALLHDAGKAVAPYRAWERIVVHLYTPRDERLDERVPPLAGAWRRHREHAATGARRIREAGGDPHVADLVERHHEPGPDPQARLLADADRAT
jgi:putative nucleotidyltransferase with HDIG domain